MRPFRPEPFTDFSKEENIKAIKDALENAKRNFGKRYPIIINGKEYKTDKVFGSFNPAHKNEFVAEFYAAGEKEADIAIESAWKAFEFWSRFPAEERAGFLFKAAEVLRRRRFEITAWMVYEVGKNWVEADADVAEAIDYLDYYAHQMLELAGNRPLAHIYGENNEYFYIPLGVVAVIPPWNFPLAILTGMTVAAVVTGNTVILKPASDSPMMGYLFMDIMREAGLPDGVINFLPGSGGSLGGYLVKHPKIRMIAFTGSKDVGVWIYEEAAKVRPGQKWLKRVIAEMGGKDAIIVDNEIDEKDIPFIANQIIVSAYGYQGQKCSAASRLIIVEDVYDKILSAVVEEAKRIEVGDPAENKFMGPVINESSEKKILNYIEIGKGEGKLVFGGEKMRGGIYDEGYYLQPTIFADVPPNAKIAQEEIFGPVLAVIKAKDFDDALRIANDTDYGLTGSVFTRNRGKIYKAKCEFHVGNLYINRKCTGAIVGVHPFGGFNMSGTDAKAGGPDYLLYFLQGKTVSERL